MLLTVETFKQFAPNAKPEFVQALCDRGNEVLTRFGINANKLRFCHFMAQLAHESARVHGARRKTSTTAPSK